MDAAQTDSVPSDAKKFCRADRPQTSVTVTVLGIYRGVMRMSVCRLSIQVERGDQHVVVDVALPSGAPLGTLLPDIVELAGQTSDEWPRGWRLDRTSGASLDESITLAENGVHDGEVLVLAASDAPPLGLARWDPCRLVADTGLPTAEGRPFPFELISAWTAVVGAVALCTGVTGHSGIHLLVAAIATCVAVALAVTVPSPAAGVAAASLASATGFLAVPSGPGAANVFLAAVAATSVAALMLRWADDASSTLVATVCFSALAAVAVIPPVLAAVPVAVVGATLTVAALGLLTVSGRAAIMLSGLTADRDVDEYDQRSIRAHAALTGLIQGCSACAALGTFLVAVGGLRHEVSTAAGFGFAAVLAVALLLRIRTHVDVTRRWALVFGGMVSALSAFIIVVARMPEQVSWASATVVAIGFGLVRPPRLSAGAVRSLEILEYAALVAVIPLACFVGGVYALARGTHP
jgi:type VII secretion integral membrane protein EccD